MNPRVSKVEYKDGYQLLLTFTNKEVKQFDLRSYLHFPVYAPLLDETFCRKVKAYDGIVQWNEYIDFDPDTLYLDSTPIG